MANNKEKDTKRLIAKLELLLGELNDFTEFTKVVQPEETDPFIWEQLAFRLEQIKLIPTEYRALSADATIISLSSENILSFSDFQSNYFRAVAQASLLLKNKDVKEQQNIADQSGRILQALRTASPLPHLLEDKLKPKALETSPASSSITHQEENTEFKVKIDCTYDSLSNSEKEHQRRIEKLHGILSGEISIELHLQFLIRSNHADLLIFKQTKETVRVSICHTVTVIANSFMHSGTTSDNLEWLARATNLTKLTATPSRGVIHRGHKQEALTLMQSYLPKEVGPSSGYFEGGELRALELLRANHEANITDYLLGQLEDTQNEMV
ncbi:hypothetical protein RN001_000742 [Aquatica leii]|uniref:Uncharacterized protein n=1 Tax=Aquatica leii TaxID=1421715 RepID=A0AAN7PKI0_9COLE|nr:hypothetical protein RN001_000742 [Aquatica leii]